MKVFYLSLALLLSLMAEGQALAAAAWQVVPAKHEFERRERGEARISMDRAIELVQRRTGGRVLAAQSVLLDGRPAYRIRVLTRGGEVREVFVDGETGEFR